MKDNIACLHAYNGTSDNFSIHRHAKEHELYLFLAGEGFYQVNDVFYQLEPGDLILINGESPHRVFITGDITDYYRSTLHFKVEWLRPTLKALNVESLLKVFDQENVHYYRLKDSALFEEVSSFFHKMQKLTAKDKSRELDQQMQVMLVGFLMEMRRIYHSDIITPYVVDKQDFNVERILNYVMANYREEMTLDDIAKNVNLSKSYMSALFKERMKLSIMDFLMQYRLFQAKNRLIFYKEESITEIALNSGFKSASHFSRVFKQDTGLTPSQYREEKEMSYNQTS